MLWPLRILSSIMNSLVIVLFLSGMVAMIMLRTLHKDIARYNQVDQVRFVKFFQLQKKNLFSVHFLKWPLNSNLIILGISPGFDRFSEPGKELTVEWGYDKAW